jgi:hypothetical protein
VIREVVKDIVDLEEPNAIKRNNSISIKAGKRVPSIISIDMERF